VSTETDLIEKLTTLNHISETLNQAVDVRSVLNDTLGHLVDLMGLETGWIFLRDEAAQEKRWGSGYVLAAHHNLPPALDPETSPGWDGGCACQEMCSQECMTLGHNEVQCSRLGHIAGERRGLALHASAPLRAGERILGILNVAASDWSSFSPQALALLENVGSQMGTALERAQLFDMLQERRIHEQAALLSYSQQLLGRGDLKDLMDYLAAEVREMLGVDATALLLPGEDPDLLAFRAARGWQNDPVAAGYRVPADKHSGPGLAMHLQRPILTKDLQEDDPTPWAPDWLLAEGFRGHGVVPLVVNGHSIGALVINARQPRLLDEGELRFLKLMANQAAIAIEKARLQEKEVRQLQMEREMELGRKIQLSLLPEACPSVPGWEFAATYRAARLVGGDFYDFIEVAPSRLGLAIGDVAGKGVPAALLMSLSRTIIRTMAMSDRSPADLLIQTNDLVLRDSHSDLFVTVAYADLDTQSGRLTYALGGHNRPLWRRASDGRIEELSAEGMVLGSLPDIALEERAIEVAPGDLLVFYTDGVTEAMDEQFALFGEERLKAAIANLAGASAQQVLDGILAEVRSFVGTATPSDDLTLFVVRRLPAE
jgi:sigma-B regulation protein RsbU (phosphoserine phosphatase)